MVADVSDSSPTIERLRAHAKEAIAYEEAGAKKDGRTPDATWDEWQRGHDILSLIEQLETRQKLIEDIHRWFQGLAAEEGDPVFEIAERVEAFAAPNPLSELKEES